jgi:hypothetical protein
MYTVYGIINLKASEWSCSIQVELTAQPPRPLIVTKPYAVYVVHTGAKTQTPKMLLLCCKHAKGVLRLAPNSQSTSQPYDSILLVDCCHQLND